ncbi:MAG: glycosyltransferase family 9 protein [Thiobacillus sp.]|nr:glycosyltransferase family 9 protein [Thiobacillus sp.]
MAPATEPRVARILVIKWSALGDMAMATAVFEDIARAHPGATIHLNTLPSLAGLFEHDPRFAEVWALDVRARGQRLSQSLAWLRRARAGRYDMVIDLQRSDHTRLLLALWVATGRAPRIRAGNRGGFPYNRQPAIRRSGAHALATMRSVLESLGIPAQTDVPVFHPAPGRREATSALMQAHGLQAGRYAVLIPGAAAAHPLKRWGAARYRELAQRLHDSAGWRLALIGGPDEVALCREIAGDRDYVIDLNGKLQLLDIPLLCAGACAVIGNDTGAAHFAAASGQPVVVLCGPTDPRRVKPIGPRVVALQARLDCINCYSPICANPAHHACMQAIEPAWLAARLLSGEPPARWGEAPVQVFE